MAMMTTQLLPLVVMKRKMMFLHMFTKMVMMPVIMIMTKMQRWCWCPCWLQDCIFLMMVMMLEESVAAATSRFVHVILAQGPGHTK